MFKKLRGMGDKKRLKFKMKIINSEMKNTMAMDGVNGRLYITGG